MTANDKMFYLTCLNELVDEYNNPYHRYIDKKYIHADYSVLIEEIESRHKALMLVPESGLPSIRISLAKVTPKTGQKK